MFLVLGWLRRCSQEAWWSITYLQSSWIQLSLLHHLCLKALETVQKVLQWSLQLSPHLTRALETTIRGTVWHQHSQRVNVDMISLKSTVVLITCVFVCLFISALRDRCGPLKLGWKWPRKDYTWSTPLTTHFSQDLIITFTLISETKTANKK